MFREDSNPGNERPLVPEYRAREQTQGALEPNIVHPWTYPVEQWWKSVQGIWKDVQAMYGTIHRVELLGLYIQGSESYYHNYVYGFDVGLTRFLYSNVYV